MTASNGAKELQEWFTKYMNETICAKEFRGIIDEVLSRPRHQDCCGLREAVKDMLSRHEPERCEETGEIFCTACACTVNEQGNCPNDECYVSKGQQALASAGECPHEAALRAADELRRTSKLLRQCLHRAEQDWGQPDPQALLEAAKAEYDVALAAFDKARRGEA